MSILTRILLILGAGLSASLGASWLAITFGPQWWPQRPQHTLAAVVAAHALAGAGMAMALWMARRHALLPLQDIVAQLRDLGEGQITQRPQPEQAEWIELAQRVNVAAAYVQHALDEREARFKNLKDEVDIDPVTQLPARSKFIQQLVRSLKGDAGGLPGGIAILRVHDLVGINQRHGRERGDELLHAVGVLLRSRLVRLDAPHAMAARLNGSDFGLLLPTVSAEAIQAWLDELSTTLGRLHSDQLTDSRHVAFIGATTFMPGEQVGEVLTRADTMVQASESERSPYRFTTPAEPLHTLAVAHWRILLEEAFDQGRVDITLTPVYLRSGRALHLDAQVRVRLHDGTELGPQQLLPAAERTGRTLDLDLRQVEIALQRLADAGAGSDIAVSLSPQSVRRPIFMHRLDELLRAAGPHAQRLCLQAPERILEGGAGDFQDLVELAVARGCKVGLVHVSLQFAQIAGLRERGLHFVKLDAALGRGLGRDHGREGFLRSLLSLIQPTGCAVIATGLDHEDDLQAALAAGLHGLSGDAITRRSRATA
jgi:EAL domain-containing protein (putative c-di-GMP-specific phosphodiesterase class I)/GGDEF domain-containing protein